MMSIRGRGVVVVMEEKKEALEEKMVCLLGDSSAVESCERS